MNVQKLVSIFLIMSLFVSCGRVMESSQASTDNGDRETQRPDTPIIIPDDFVKSQKLICDDVMFCPESIAKLIIIHKNKATQCIGTLIEEDKILASASCLPRSLRVRDFSCAKTVFGVFAKSKFSPGEIIGCDKIEYVNNNQFKEPALWQSDLVVFKMRKKLNRVTPFVSYKGFRDNEKLTTWKIENKASNISVIKSQNCQSFMSTYLNPLSDNPFSSMFVSTRCSLSKSDVGAPMYRGENLVGIYSAEMKTQTYNLLKGSKVVQGKLGRYYHVNNISCSDFAETYFGLLPPKRCFERKTTAELDSSRSKMLKSADVHKENIAMIKKELEGPGKYFSWNVNFQYIQNNKSNKLRSLEAHFGKPKCILNSKSWIGEYRTWNRKWRTLAIVNFETPNYVLITKLDESLKATSVLKSDEIKEYTIKFNPHAAHFKQKTYVTVASNINGKETSATYDELDRVCQTEVE